MLRPLEALLQAIGREDRAPTVLFTGDYVNRGANVRQTIDLLLSLSNARFVRGNHDDIFDLVIHGRCYADNAANNNRMEAFRWFMNHGLDDTFTSYGADLADLQFLAEHPSLDRLQEVIELIPPRHRNFIGGLPALIEETDLFVAHAKWGINDPSELPSLGVQLATRPGLRHRVLWGRYTSDEVKAPKAWERTGVFGHTPVTHYLDAREPDDLVPVLGPKIVLVDTAAALFAGGRLTAYCPETEQYLQADRFGGIYRSQDRED